jgi:ABC-type dipeptide/oligopeptide/nickel transport system permease subunit
MSPLAAISRNTKARLGALLLLGFALMAAVGPWLVSDPAAFVSVPHAPPSSEHWLGTTGQGQDVLAQTVVGARITLLVGFVVGAAVVALGALVGGTAGYLGGRTDDALSLLMNVFLVMPGLPLMVVLAAWLPQGPATMTAVLIVTGWAWNARVMRAQTMALRNQDFVVAAVVAGEPAWRVVVVEILPNMASLLVSTFIGATLYAIGAQVGLEFLGLGDLSVTTWGTNLYWASNDSALLLGAWWTFVPTGLCIALVGFGLTLVNFGLDEVTNPRLRAPRSPLLQGLGPGPVSTPVRRVPAGEEDHV